MDITQIQALTFDMFGTVTDWRRTIMQEGEALSRSKGCDVDWNAFALAWRAGYQPAMQRVRSGELPWTTIDVLHRLILDDILEEFGIDWLTDDEIAQFNRVWHRLTPWPDARTGLARLRSRFTLATLSNGNVALLTDMTKHADLRFDCILSAELARAYKPDPQVYLIAVQLLGLRPEQVMMVAAHNADLRGAHKAGLRTAFVHRTDEYGSDQSTDLTPDADVDVSAIDLHDLADRLNIG